MFLYLINLFILISQFNYLSTQFVCPSSFGLYSDPLKCTNYYECENFIPTSKVCGSGLHFNQMNQVCDWSANAGCSINSMDSNPNNNLGDQNSPNDNPTTNIQNSNHITFRCHADGLYEDPISCNHFVECNNGSPFRKICPANLHFDIRIKACNWPESMECKKHTKPLITEKPISTNQPIYTFTTPVSSTFTYATPPPDNDYNKPFNDDSEYPERKPDHTTSRPYTRPTTQKTTTSTYNEVNNCEWCFKCPNREDKYYENNYDKFTYYHCYKGEAFLMYCPRNEKWVQRKQVCELINNRNENNNSNSDDYSSDDGAGLIDPRIKQKSKTTTTQSPKDSLSLRQALPRNIDSKSTNTTSKSTTTQKPTTKKKK